MENWQRVAVEVEQEGEASRIKRVRRVRKGRKNRKKYLLLGACILFLLSGTAMILSLFLYQTGSATYNRSLIQARDGMQQMRLAEKFLTELQHNPFDANAIGQARLAFVKAENDFGQLQATMQTIPGISMLMPVYGSRIAAASHLVPLALAATQAGVAGCDLLNVLITRFHDPLNAHQGGLTMADFSTIDGDFGKIEAAFTVIEREASQLQPGDVQFEPGLSQEVATLQHDLPAIKPWVDDIAQLLPVLPTLLGVDKPANYLIEVLDSTELRPGGGFVGNYGVATLAGGRLQAAHITDVDLLDYPFVASGKTIAFPEQYQWFAHALSLKSWSLRDSDLDADFPTAARYAEQNYQIEGGKTSLQGVVAITPALIEQIMTITGPISVPEYNETVTAQNLIARIHFHQLGGSAAGEGSDRVASPDGHSSMRKRFTELLAEHLLARIRQLPLPQQFKLLQVVAQAVHTKDIQIYLNLSPAEQVLRQAGLDSAIQATPDDGFMVVDANIYPSKANSFIVNTLNDEVTIDGAGNALHHTTLSYAWILPGKNYGSSIYGDYVRIYLPNGSTMQGQQGWVPKGESVSFEHNVWAGYISLTYGQTRTVTLTWMRPHAATQNTNDWHYQDFMQHQAGTRWQVHLHITLPSYAMVLNKEGGLAANGSRTMTLNQVMDEDFTVGLDYSC
jgi:Protein of unknown function (DUF4012)